MDASNGILCWTPNTSDIEVVPYPDDNDRCGNRLKTSLVCYTFIQNMDFEQRKAFIFKLAVIIMVEDNVPPAAVHNALMVLDEYKDGLKDLEKQILSMFQA